MSEEDNFRRQLPEKLAELSFTGDREEDAKILDLLMEGWMMLMAKEDSEKEE